MANKTAKERRIEAAKTVHALTLLGDAAHHLVQSAASTLEVDGTFTVSADYFLMLKLRVEEWKQASEEAAKPTRKNKSRPTADQGLQFPHTYKGKCSNGCGQNRAPGYTTCDRLICY